MKKMIVILLIAALVFAVNRCKKAERRLEAQAEYITLLEEDKKTLIADKIELYRENEELRDRDVPLVMEAVQTAAKTPEPLPKGDTNVISGMPYTALTNKVSEQWALQLDAYTGRYGVRCYSDGEREYFLAAMGSAYGRTIGEAFKITLECGTEFFVMMGDFKDDGSDPDFFGHPAKNYDGESAVCILEFIYDPGKIDKAALDAGNFCTIEQFGGLHGNGGNIAKIERLGRKWGND